MCEIITFVAAYQRMWLWTLTLLLWIQLPLLPLAYLHTCHTHAYTQTHTLSHLLILRPSKVFSYIYIYTLHTETYTIYYAYKLLNSLYLGQKHLHFQQIASQCGIIPTHTPVILIHAMANLFNTPRHTLQTHCTHTLPQSPAAHFPVHSEQTVSRSVCLLCPFVSPRCC